MPICPAPNSAAEMTMPVAIAEAGIPGVRRALGPAQLSDVCRTDLLSIDGRPVGIRLLGTTAAAKRLGIPDSRLWNWIRLRRVGKFKASEGGVEPVKRSVAEVEAENVRLRRELASTKLDLEIVKKAAAYFAKESR